MGAFLVRMADNECGATRHGDGDAMLISANSPEEAYEMAAAHFASDGVAWAGTSAGCVAEADFATDVLDWANWEFRVIFEAGFGVGGADPKEVAVTLEYDSENPRTIDEVGTALAVALNATSEISNAAYNSTTQQLTITGAADGLGDQACVIQATPPDGDSPITAIFANLTDRGASGDPITVDLPSDTAVVPTVMAVVKVVGKHALV